MAGQAFRLRVRRLRGTAALMNADFGRARRQPGGIAGTRSRAIDARPRCMDVRPAHDLGAPTTLKEDTASYGGRPTSSKPLITERATRQ